MNTIIRSLKTQARCSLRNFLWQRAARKIPQEGSSPPPPFRNLLIIASDPGSVVGSRGDDAMFSAVVLHARRQAPDGCIGVVSVSAELPPIGKALGLVAEPIWLDDDYDSYLATLERYDSVIMIGADVMDGHYGEANAVRFWAMCDLAVRSGRRAFVLGCSFSDHIAAPVARAMRQLSPKLRVYARDSKSKVKFDAVSNLTAELVADSAFLVEPTATAPDHAAVSSWVDAQHQAGRFVCAFNTHPMIFYDDPLEEVKALNAKLAAIMPRLAERYPVSYLLVPHDFRGETQGDNVSLQPLHQLLDQQLGERVFYAPSEARASELKALVSCADMLVTGRMHLGVGALSMGVPIWGLSPQDKFAGLFEHFGLGDLRITPRQAEDPAALEAFLDNAFANWTETRDRVRSALPEVKRLSSRNFELLET